MAGAFLFRKLENVGETYPSLFTAARRSPSARPDGGDEELEADDVDEGSLPSTTEESVLAAG